MGKHIFTFILSFMMISCAKTLKPEGDIIERGVSIPENIESIEIADGMNLILTDGFAAGEAVIRTHENIQPYIKAKTDGNKVTFMVDAHRYKNLDVTVTASLKQYNNFTASGGAHIYSPDPLSLPQATFNISGGSQATFVGECSTAKIECSGGSRMYGYDLSVQTAQVNISGGSRLEFTVTGSLTGDNSGGSIISYKGSPSIINVNNSGGSQTIKQ